MRKYLTKERVFVIVGLIVLMLGLTSCSGDANKYLKPIQSFGDETGILKILVWPIAWLMYQIGRIFPSGQYAWGLLFTTIIIRTLAWPIYAKSNDMSLKMAVAQPEIQKVQAKYANRQDPQSKQRMQQELMTIYKKHKINFLGCLTPILQMPIFIAMYNVVSRIRYTSFTPMDANGVATGETIFAKFALSNTNFLGIKDCLSYGVYTSGGGGNMGNQAATWSGAFWVGIILSIIVGGSMWLLNFLAQRKPKYQKNTYQHNANANQQQNQMGSTMKFMSYFMIVMMVLASLGNNGLALYWVIGNLYSIAQNFINRYLNEKKYYKLKKEHSIDNLI